MRISRRQAALLISGTALAGLTGCSPLDAVSALTPGGDLPRDIGLSFGPHPRHKLDIYWPATPDPAKPVLVFFYGGSWRRGNRDAYRFVGQAFADKGFVTVLPDYRLYPETAFPGFVEDGAAAVSWVAAHLTGKPPFTGTTPKVVVAGHSAGAHTAALLLLDRRYLTATDAPIEPMGLLGLAGPYSFDPQIYDSTRPVFATADPPASAIPLSFARGDAGPALLIHGADDSLVRPMNSERLAASITAKGGQAVYRPIPDTGHSEVLLALSTTFARRPDVLDSSVAFLTALS